MARMNDLPGSDPAMSGARHDLPHPTAGSDPLLIDAIRAEIAAGSGAENGTGAAGRITFARFMELALYHPERGYYLAAARRPGRGGDFLTAPEASPLFGLTLARQIAECWVRLGRPRPFTVREYGPGIGGLAFDILVGLHTETPEIVAALDYRLVEPNRHRVAQALAAMAEVGFGALVTAEAPPLPGADLPPVTGVILANEVADAFPVHPLVARDGAFREQFVTWRTEDGETGSREDGKDQDGRAPDAGRRTPDARNGWFGLEEGLPSTPDLAGRWAALAAAGVTLRDGDIVEVSPAAAAWFAGAGRGLARGYAVVIDYGYPAAELYSAHRLGGLVRGYAGHTVTDDPFVRIGRQDLTAHVDFTALEAAGREVGLVPAGLTTQGAFLSSLGLGDALLRLQADPTTAPADYFAAQAAVMRLIEPGGLGRFRVLLMARDAPVDPPLQGMSIVLET